MNVFARQRKKELKKELSLANFMDLEREGTIQFSQHLLINKHGSKHLTYSAHIPPSVPLFYYTDIGESLQSRGQFLTAVDLGWPDPHPSP